MISISQVLQRLIKKFLLPLKKRIFKKYKFYKPLLSFILEKVFITILYIIPYLSVTYTTHSYIQRFFPEILRKITPFGEIIFSSNKYAKFVFESPLIFLGYYFGTDVILSQKYGDFKIPFNVKLALLLTTTIELFHSLVLLYFDLFNFTSTVAGIRIKMTFLAALFYLLVHMGWVLIYFYLYYTSMRGVIPKVPSHPFLTGIRKSLDSLLFLIRVKESYNKKK